MKSSLAPFFASALLATSMLFTAPAAAQELQLLPPGQTLLTLSVTERAQVQQDTLTASLRIEVTDKNADVVQDKINAAMKKAVETAKGVSSVKASTGYYSVYQNYVDPKSRAEKTWHGSQTIDIEGKNAKDVLELAGKIQSSGFLMNNLSYSLSTEKADEVRENLLESALTRAKAKAERTAKGLGKKEVELVQVGIDTPVDYPQPVMMRGMMAKAEMAADSVSTPVAEASESDVTLTINVRAIAK